MTRTTHATPNIQFARCFYRLPNGKRCQLYVSDAFSRFCTKHLPATPHTPIRPTIVQDSGPIEIDLSAELGIAAPGDFKDNEEIYYILGKLTYLLAANRISSRRAAVLAYITSGL